MMCSYPASQLAIILLAAAVASGYASSPPSRAMIDQGARICCPREYQHCCHRRLLGNQTLRCKNFDGWRDAAACLERFFYNESIIQSKADKCCWLLYNDECRATCLRNLRRPTLPLSEKLTFTNVCPLMLSKTTGRLEAALDLRDGGKDEPECLEDSTVKTHQCFSKCLSWMENQPDAGEDVEFDTAQCPEMQDFESKDPCILFDSDEEP